MAQLDFAPKFTEVRSVSGALAVDSAANDTNFPPYNAAHCNPKYNNFLIYWEGTNADVMDSIDLRILIRDTVNDTWLTGPVLQAVPPNTPMAVNVNKIGMFTIRVEAINVHAGITDLKIFAALGAN